jgi:integrase
MEYTSVFAPHITGLIEQKRALGYKYNSEAALLRRFDAFCLERHPNETVLNREVMMDWAVKRIGEKPSTLQGRLTPVRELSKYIVRLGLEAHIMPKGLMPRVPRYIPHIYTNEELIKIFEQTDKCHYCSEVPYRHHVMPVFFRLLYCTGMRLSEARLLKMGDVDLDDGVITVTNAKFDKHRQLPVSPEMLARLLAYHQNVHAFSKTEDWFFPGYGGKPMTLVNVDFSGRQAFLTAVAAKAQGCMISDIHSRFTVCGAGCWKTRICGHIFLCCKHIWDTYRWVTPHITFT